MLKRALADSGVTIDADADVAVHYGYAELFRPLPGKWNVLFSMYESPYLSPGFITALRMADQVVVPSRYCAELFARHTDRPIDVCPLGVDRRVFRPRARRWNKEAGERFRWLYVGAPNYRKITILPELYAALLRDLPCELYIKTTGAMRSPELLEQFDPWACEIFDEGQIVRSYNWTIDNRYLPQAELVDLYHSAHGFLFLHCGEGFGLTGLEAMATGLAPVISDSTGTREYADATCAYPVLASVKPVRQKNAAGEEFVQELPWPDAIATMRAVGDVMTEYDEARRRGGRAVRRAAAFSWGEAARRLCVVAAKAGILGPSNVHGSCGPRPQITSR